MQTLEASAPLSCTLNIHGNIMHNYNNILYTDKCVSVRGSIRKVGKDKALSSSSLLPTLRGISGTAWPTVRLFEQL